MPTHQPKRSDDAITVRMYRVGFGDCFLIGLPTTSGRRFILVDCGVRSPGGDIRTIERAVADIASVTDRKLAIVIATHAHQDHVLGFDRFFDEFAKFEIEEIWLPWTWDPSDPRAKELYAKQDALSAALTAHFASLGAAARSDDRTSAAGEAAANATGNERAVSALRSGFGRNPKVRYLEAGDSLTAPASLAELSVTVLGPPRSTDFFAQMDPPGSEEYLRVADGAPGGIRSIAPFRSRWWLTAQELRALGTRLGREEEDRLSSSLGTSPEDLAFAIDKARNNESVVVLLSYRGQNLLLAGDAQWGNWRGWIEDQKRGQILGEVTFYKVSHHGSINATPKSALERMSDGRFVAMVSTQSVPWASIPRPRLMARLNKKTRGRLFRSDWIDVKGAPTPLADAEPPQPKKRVAGLVGGELWFEYALGQNGGARGQG